MNAKIGIGFLAVALSILMVAMVAMMAMTSSQNDAVTSSTSASTTISTTTTTSSTSSTSSTTSTTIKQIYASANTPNYAGYSAGFSENVNATSISADWKAPYAMSGIVAQWIGITGRHNGSFDTLVQTGTMTEGMNIQNRYYDSAWYAFSPELGAINQFQVNAGDSITANITAQNGYWVIRLKDLTLGENFTQKVSDHGYTDSWAYWIIESPGLNASVKALGDFNSTGFSNTTATFNGKSNYTLCGINRTEYYGVKSIPSANGTSLSAYPTNTSCNSFYVSYR